MKLLRSIALAILAGLLPTASVAQTIVWTDVNGRRIQRKDVHGGEIGTIVQFQSPQAAYQLHYDPVSAKFYYQFTAPPTGFYRSNVNGSDPENIPTPTWGNFALNVDSRKLYWSVGFGGDVLYHSELDGSGVESHTYPSSGLLTLEAVGDDLFFGASNPAKGVWRADADGSNEQFLHGSGQPIDLAHDPVENKLYLATIDTIYRLNPDGTGFQQILPVFQAGAPGQVEVDAWARKLYWTEPTARVIRRSNLDGSNVEDFVTASDVGNPNLNLQGLTIVYNSKPIPTVSGWSVAAMGVLLLGAGVFVLRRRARWPLAMSSRPRP